MTSSPPCVWTRWVTAGTSRPLREHSPTRRDPPGNDEVNCTVFINTGRKAVRTIALFQYIYWDTHETRSNLARTVLGLKRKLEATEGSAWEWVIVVLCKEMQEEDYCTDWIQLLRYSCNHYQPIKNSSRNWIISSTIDGPDANRIISNGLNIFLGPIKTTLLFAVSWNYGKPVQPRAT